MPVQMTLEAPPRGVPVKLWTDTAQGEALDQRKNVARLPITYSILSTVTDRPICPVEERGATPHHLLPRRGDAGRALRPRRSPSGA